MEEEEEEGGNSGDGAGAIDSLPSAVRLPLNLARNTPVLTPLEAPLPHRLAPTSSQHLLLWALFDVSEVPLSCPGR